MVVATDRGIVIGFAGHRIVWDTNVISDCYVIAERQGQGVGTKMLDALLPKSGEFMTLASQDPKAQALYRKWGMAPIIDCPYVRGSAESATTRDVSNFPIPEADLPHLVADLGCRFVSVGEASVAAVTDHSIESSLIGLDDDPVMTMAAWLGAVGGRVEVQLSEAHPAYQALDWEEFDRDTMMATPGADLPDYRRVTFNGDLLAISSQLN
jgi:hypothetical protein